jgi:hypothetical protein
VNGDGYADVIVGARFHDSQGAAYVFHGSETGPGVTADWTASAESQLDSYGTSVASAGDVNGDGYADVIVGASVAESTAGRVYVYLGNDGGGRLVLAQQARADGSRLPVQPWGLSHVPDGFYLRMWTTDPMGRGRVKLEVEACPPGVAFGDAACARHRSSAWKDVTATASGIQVATTISGLDAETLYRWRARVLWAPYTVDQPGIAPPANPAHGPWRRFLGQAMEADLRTTEAAAPAWKVFLPVVVRE